MLAGLLGGEMGAKSVVLRGNESLYITNKLRLLAKMVMLTILSLPPLLERSLSSE